MEVEKRTISLKDYSSFSTTWNTNLIDSSSIDFIEWLQQKELEKKKTGTAGCIDTLIAHMTVFLEREYPGQRLTIGTIDKDFCLRFSEYLFSAHNLRAKQARLLAPGSRRQLFALLKAQLNKAVREGLLTNNPLDTMDRAHIPPLSVSERSFLTVSEVKALEVHPACPERVRRAFLFSCFCGLRWSDVRSLRWSDVRKDGDNWLVAKKMVKTGEWIFIPINYSARAYMPKEGSSATEYVFDLPSVVAANGDIKRWARRAGISKNVSFHTARHTFATLLITQGADLYTTSKLLGHTNISTTQIYASIVDEKKWRAVRLLDKLPQQ